jgi:hypothetical protein
MTIEQVDPVLARLAALEDEVAELRGQAQASAPEPEPEQPVTRRRLMGMAGVAAAGAVGATVLSASPAGAIPPGSMDGDSFALGSANGCASTTSVLATTDLTGLKGQTLASGGAGVEGVCDLGTTGNGVKGTSTTGNGVNGISSARNGVIGTGPLNGVAGIGTGLVSPGVRGQNDSGYDAIGVVGQAATGLGLWGTGGRAQLYLSPNGSVGAPTANLHAKGEFFVDVNGVLFYNTADGTPGQWVRQAPLVPLASPVRVFDSRTGQPNAGGTTQGPLTFTLAPPSAAFRDVNCSQNAVGGAVVVPPGATTILMNMAIVTGSGVGALTAYATGSPQPDTASINWSAGGQVLSNAVTSACNATQHVNVAIVASAGASTHFILDVVGYYR